MGAPGWNPLPVGEVVALFAAAPFRWWIAGGRALELHVGRSWRDHDDTDVGVRRSDVPLLGDVLAGWDVFVSDTGNNRWYRRSPDAPWAIDATVGEGDDDWWIYRRDPALRLPWDDAVLRTADDVPYLAPELQLLFKSKDVRPKDDEDARQVLPVLDPFRRARLWSALPLAHPWRAIGE